MNAAAETSEMLADNGEPIVVIEYQKQRAGWKPHAVIAGSSCYDFDWCEKDGVLAHHNSGGGGTTGEIYELHGYCAAPKLCAKLWYDRRRLKLTDDGKPISDKEARSLGYQVLREPLDGNPFDDPDAVQDGTTYCVQCRGRHPDEQMCAHVQWNDGGNGYCLGCGAEDVDFGEAQASLYRLLRMLPSRRVEAIREKLLRRQEVVGDPNRWLGEFAAERNCEERYWPGIAWLYSLDRGCREAMALTAGWVWMFERKQWRACHFVPSCRFIRHLPQPQLDEWLALDPLDPRQLHDRPLRVKLGFEAKCLNDTEFLRDPTKCEEVCLWPPARKGAIHGRQSLTLSVAEVRPAGRRAVDLYCGAVIERNGLHVSELDGYREPYLW